MEAGGCLVEKPLARFDNGQIEMQRGLAEAMLGGSAKGDRCLIQLALLGKGISEIVVSLGVFRVQINRFTKARLGRRNAQQLGIKNSQAIVAARILRRNSSARR